MRAILKTSGSPWSRRRVRCGWRAALGSGGDEAGTADGASLRGHCRSAIYLRISARARRVQVPFVRRDPAASSGRRHAPSPYSSNNSSTRRSARRRIFASAPCRRNARAPSSSATTGSAVTRIAGAPCRSATLGAPSTCRSAPSLCMEHRGVPSSASSSPVRSANFADLLQLLATTVTEPVASWGSASLPSGPTARAPFFAVEAEPSVGYLGAQRRPRQRRVLVHDVAVGGPGSRSAACRPPHRPPGRSR